MTKRLIVNADDFGASSGTNRGIIDCHRDGVLTSASLMVYGAAVEEAVALAGEHPRLAIGLHWDVVGEDEREFDLSDHAAVGRELELQLRRFESLLGRGPTHIDSHRHTHLDDDVKDYFLSIAAIGGAPVRGDGRVAFVGGFYAQWEWGRTELEHVSVGALERILRDEVGEGWTEISCHPGYVSPEYRPMYRSEREAEVRTLTDRRIRATVDELGIQLETYATYSEQR